jgi:hypothetical protein
MIDIKLLFKKTINDKEAVRFLLLVSMYIVGFMTAYCLLK